MTLGFSTHHPDGSPTLFEQKILLPYNPELQRHYPNLLPKTHTFRHGHRWRAGMTIHMVTGNRTPRRKQFNTGIPALSTCISVEPALICCDTAGRISIAVGQEGSGQRWLSSKELLLFAANDGFNSLEELTRWFFPKYDPIAAPLVGQIVHWTDFQYQLST